tara:strand:- start:1319 stop:1903 length:585 start_codon:yes stop_codon:yes gene_type:complete
MNTQQFLITSSCANHENLLKKSGSNENMKKSSSTESFSKTQIVPQQPYPSLPPKPIKKIKSCEDDLNKTKSNLPPKPIRKTKSYECDLNIENMIVPKSSIKKTNSYEENLQLKVNETNKEFEDDVNYYNKNIDYKKAIYETIKTQAPGLLLDIAKESQHIDSINQLKDNFGDVVLQHVTDSLVTTTLTHIIHKI